MPTTPVTAPRDHIDDVRIREIKELAPPSQIIEEFPSSERTARTTFEARNAIHRILHGADDRLLVVVGPCSIHDTDAAMEYAAKLKQQADRLQNDLLIVMRVYFEKPRTTVGWKGLINDPYLDDSFRINDGLRLARKLLWQINELGLPAGTEFLDMITPQYIADLIAWGAIGARTTESQVHRQLASGLSCPVGFKNGTDGDIRIAIDAIKAAQSPHHFLSVTKAGHSAIVSTAGNEDCHIILRGGKEPNYDAASIDAACKQLAAAGVPAKLIVDFSHGNSRKQYALQIEVGSDIAGQLAAGEERIMGIMCESHLVEGRQDLLPGKPLEYGKSITDACIGWEPTIGLLDTLAEGVRQRRAKIAAGE
ncbi:MAG: phospho-2-dehydro-3-deoxyheptonate aldolase [Rhodocyclales bacterium]|nr:phospho-2-dehydro-3-deoxyheptonate aldolase [Rhodocyclales bacterium]